MPNSGHAIPETQWPRSTCWWCGKPIHKHKPPAYSLRGYACFMHEPCARQAGTTETPNERID